MFLQRYGPWALITGGSEGLGAEFARQLAARGMNLVLVARRPQVLQKLSSELRGAFSVDVLPLPLDMTHHDAVDSLCARTAGLEVGLLVCSAACSPLGDFLEVSEEDHRRLVDLNCRVPALLSWRLGREMTARGRGGIILVSSMAGSRERASWHITRRQRPTCGSSPRACGTSFVPRGSTCWPAAQGLSAPRRCSTVIPSAPPGLPRLSWTALPWSRKPCGPWAGAPWWSREQQTAFPVGSPSVCCPGELESGWRASGPGRCIPGGEGVSKEQCLVLEQLYCARRVEGLPGCPALRRGGPTGCSL